MVSFFGVIEWIGSELGFRGSEKGRRRGFTELGGAGSRNVGRAVHPSSFTAGMKLLKAWPGSGRKEHPRMKAKTMH